MSEVSCIVEAARSANAPPALGGLVSWLEPLIPAAKPAPPRFGILLQTDSRKDSEMANTELSSLGSGKSIVWAIVVILFGFLAIALPLATSLGVVIVIAWLILLAGGFQLIHAFQSKGIGSTLWKVVVAILYVAVGIYFLLNPLLGVASFTLALAIFFVAEGGLDLVIYFQNRTAGGAGWILLNGIITLILGIMVWRQWPSSSLWLIGTLVGFSMIMTGTARLMISLAARRATA
jgi:uncharacterized membrane protein HdeD (DUF308 family)